jgi:hypothetical protein
MKEGKENPPYSPFLPEEDDEPIYPYYVKDSGRKKYYVSILLL